MSNVLSSQLCDATDASTRQDAASFCVPAGSIEILRAEKEAEVLRGFTHHEKVQALDVPIYPFAPRRFQALTPALIPALTPALTPALSGLTRRV